MKRGCVDCQGMIARDSAGILKQLDEAVQAGVDAGQMGEQLLGICET